VLAVIRLDPRESGGDQLRQQLVEPDHGPGMSERGNPAVRSHERHGVERGQADARDVRRRILRDKGVEGLVITLHVALLEERLRQVRASERSALRDLENACEIHGVAEHVQLFDHEFDAPATLGAKPPETVLEGGIRGINEIPEHVRIAPRGLGVELRRRDDPYAEAPARGLGLCDSRQRVVIREGLDRHAARRGALHQVRRRERAVRAQRVRVQVDRVALAYGSHSRSSRSIERERPVWSSTSTTTLLN